MSGGDGETLMLVFADLRLRLLRCRRRRHYSSHVNELSQLLRIFASKQSVLCCSHEL